MISPTNGTGNKGSPKDTRRKVIGVEIEGFLHFLLYRKGASKTTIDTYKSILTRFEEYLGGRELTLEEIDNYAIHLSTRDLKPKTYRCQLNCIRSYVKYLWIKDKTKIKPESIIVPKETFVEAEFLLPEEVARLLRVVKSKRDRAMLLVLLSSGVRVSELTGLRREDMLDRSIIVRNGKGGKPRVVFITKEAEDAYRDYHRGMEPGWMFPNCNGERMSRQYVARLVKRYSLLAGIQKSVHTHTLRHTMATTMLRNGARVDDVSQILGHTNIRNTMYYLHYSNDLLKKAYEKHMEKQSQTCYNKSNV